MKNENYKVFQVVEEFIKENKIDEAIDLLRELNELEPNDTVIKSKLARVLAYNKDNYKEAKEYFEELLSTKSRSYALFELGKLEAKEKNNEKAKYYFNKLLKEQENNSAMQESEKEEDIRIIHELGKLEAKEGNYDEARNLFQKILDKKYDAYAMLELGKIEVCEGDHEEARSIFNWILELEDNAHALTELMFLDINEGNYRAAYNKFKKIPRSFIYKNQWYEVWVFLRYKLGILKDEEITRKTYYISQLLDYNRNRTIAHTIESHGEEFYDEVNIEELYDYSKEKIKGLEPIYVTGVSKYIVKCDYGIANIGGYETKTLKVVTFPRSNKIISIYPIKYKGEKQKQKRY